mmetsp:Transcript_4319/g.10563  ORF Transcript_4319/g.10563 Transcript_4319/m.10563 type:complete len:329 (+) Transcript_4319:113-1099(+)
MDDTSFDFRRPEDAPKKAAPPAEGATDNLVGGSVTYVLHPLVVINISDHHTRVSAQKQDAGSPRVFGILLGEQSGRRVEVANSFEIKVTTNASGAYEPAADYLKIRLEQYKKTFPNYECIGWYSTAASVQPGDMAIHQSLCQMNEQESLLYLVLDPVQALVQGNRDLPILLHESEVHVVNDTPTMCFAKVGYKIDSIESERIAVDHVAHILPSGDSNSGSALAQHIGTQYTAISVLSERIKVIQDYAKAVAEGRLPTDHELMRQIKSLCARLPALNSSRLNEEFLCDSNDALLITYMSTITKGTSAINEIIDKFNTAYDKHSRRRGMF